MNSPKSDAILLLLLRLGAFLCFAGWTWVHYYWEGPYGVLLWHEGTYELADSFGVTWDEFVGDGVNEGLVQRWIAHVTWLYLGCTVLTLTVRKGAWLQMSGLLIGSGLLTVLSYAKYVKAQGELPMFIEHGGQILMPVLLVLAVAFGPRHRAVAITAVVALIMTFAGHGAYAVGLWPTPANYYAMTTVLLGFEYETTKTLLRAAGLLDFAVCLGIFIPLLRRPSSAYAAVWGLLTALARPAAGMSTSLNYWGADQFVHEAVLRAPHFIIPLFLFLLWRKPNAASVESSEDSSTNQP